MKKMLSVCALVLLLALSLSACGSYDPAEYVTLGEYKGVTVEFNEDYTVTDAEVDEAINTQLREDATETKEITDRGVKWGDKVNVDYVGKLDGKAFEGGSAEKQSIEVSEVNSYIEGFVDALIGHKKGDTFDAPMTFPEDYHKKDLAGKKVIFTFTINKVEEYVLPELTDKYVSGAYNYATLDAWKAALKEDLAAEKKEKAITERDNAVWAAVMAGCKFSGVPQREVDKYVKEEMAYMEEYAAYYGYDLATLLAYQGFTEETYRKQLVSAGENYVKEKMVLELIAVKENLTITDEYYLSHAGKMAEEYSYKTLTEFEGAYGKETIKQQLLWDRVSSWLIENAKTVAPGSLKK